jgi:hypothetical protein
MAQPTSDAREDLRLRLLRRGEIDQREASRLLDAIVESFGTWPAFDPGVPPLDHLWWKMSSPAGDMAAILGEVDGEVACCQVCLSQRVRVGAALISRVRSADFAVCPAFRGRGLGSALWEFKSTVLERPTLRLTESRAPEIRHLTRKEGARPLGNPVLALLLPLSARWDGGGSPAQRESRSVVGNLALLLASRWQRAGRARGKSARATSGPPPAVRRVERFDARFGPFWEEARRAFEVAVERTPEYLDWRYADPRGGRWNVDASESEAAVLGYCAWRVDGRLGIIGDLLALPERLDVVESLVDAAVAGARAAAAASLLCWLPRRHPYRDVLHGRGFIDRPTRVTHMLWPSTLTPELAALLLAPSTRVHFTLGDSDFL